MSEETKIDLELQAEKLAARMEQSCEVIPARSGTGITLAPEKVAKLAPLEPCGDLDVKIRDVLRALRNRRAPQFCLDMVLGDVMSLIEKHFSPLIAEHDEARETARETLARADQIAVERDGLRTRLERAADMLQDSRNGIQALLLSRDPVCTRAADQDAAWAKATERARKTLHGIDSFEPLTSVTRRARKAERERDSRLREREGWTESYRQLHEECEGLQRKLDVLAKQYKDQEHDLAVARLALKAANENGDYWAYDPTLGDEQFKTLANDVIVRIPAGWLQDFIWEKAEAEAGAAAMREAIPALYEGERELCTIMKCNNCESGRYTSGCTQRARVQAAEKALSSDCGKAMLERVRAVEAACAEMREALEFRGDEYMTESDVLAALRIAADAVRAHSGYDPATHFEQTAEMVKSALSSSCGTTMLERVRGLEGKVQRAEGLLRQILNLPAQGKADEFIPDDKNDAYEMGYGDAVTDGVNNSLAPIKATIDAYLNPKEGESDA